MKSRNLHNNKKFGISSFLALSQPLALLLFSPIILCTFLLNPSVLTALVQSQGADQNQGLAAGSRSRCLNQSDFSLLLPKSHFLSLLGSSSSLVVLSSNNTTTCWLPVCWGNNRRITLMACAVRICRRSAFISACNLLQHIEKGLCS